MQLSLWKKVPTLQLEIGNHGGFRLRGKHDVVHRGRRKQRVNKGRYRVAKSLR